MRGGESEIKKERKKNLERGAAGEAGKSMCRASLEGYVLQVYLGSR